MAKPKNQIIVRPFSMIARLTTPSARSASIASVAVARPLADQSAEHPDRETFSLRLRFGAACG
jgi:hypothetical protein